LFALFYFAGFCTALILSNFAQGKYIKLVLMQSKFLQHEGLIEASSGIVWFF
jgi:hypothetical protein